MCVWLQEKNFVIIVFAFTAIGYVSSKFIEQSIQGSFSKKDVGSTLDGSSTIEGSELFNETLRTSEQRHVNDFIGQLLGDFQRSTVILPPEDDRESSCVESPHLRPRNLLASPDAKPVFTRFREVLTPKEAKKLMAKSKHPFVDASDALELAKIDAGHKEPDVRLVLYAVVEKKLEALIETWNIDPSDEEQISTRLRAKAVEFYKLAEKGLDVVPALTLQSTFGDDSWQYKCYSASQTNMARNFLYITMVVFIWCAYTDDPVTKSSVGILCLIPYTVDTVMLAWQDWYAGAKPGLSRKTFLPILINALLWGTQLASAIDSSLNDNRNFILVEDFFRPWMLLVKSPALTNALLLLIRCIHEAREIFFYLFTVVSIAAIMVNLLFWQKWDPTEGQTVDNFLESFVYTFIFMTSGENWDGAYY